MSSRGRGRGKGRGRGRDSFQGNEKTPGFNYTGQISSEKLQQCSGDSSQQLKSCEQEKSKGRGKKHYRDDDVNVLYDQCQKSGASYFEKKHTRQVVEEDPVKKEASEDAHSLGITQAASERRFKFAPFPGYGTAGHPIDLIVNYYDLKCNLSNVYHYNVEINAADKSRNYTNQRKTGNRSHVEQQQHFSVGRKKCQEVFEQLLKNERLDSFKPIYDGGNNLFTVSPLPVQKKTSFSIDVEVNGRKKTYIVVIQPVKKVDGSNVISLQSVKNCNLMDVTNEAMLALNAIMNHRDPGSSQIRVGRSFFSITQIDKISAGEGLEIWRGYNQSVHLTEKGPAVVINLSAKVFHKAGPIINYVNEVLGRDRDVRAEHKSLSFFEISKIEKALRGVRVFVLHLRYQRKYYINGISKQPAKELITSIDGQRITIAEYFKRKYGALKYPHLPCLHMRTSNDKTYIPFEHCSIIEGQPKLAKNEELSPRVAAKMINETAVPPIERFKKINDYAHEATKESGKKMKDFGLFMNMKQKEVQGRVIDPPDLKYLDSPNITPSDTGTWGMKGKFVKSLRIGGWIVLSFADERAYPRRKLEDCALRLQSVARSYGLYFGDLLDICIFGRHDSTRTALENEKVRQASLAIIVLSKKDSYHNYDEIKFIADYRLGLVNQCILDERLDRFTNQIATNISLKINAKLGGVNHQLAVSQRFFSKPVIIFGADVVHSTFCPSIASVVGSLDKFPSKYHVSCRVQDNQKRGKKSQELILDMEDMVKKILKQFYNNTFGKYPENIVFFRDGVSEGQFEAVCNHEVTAIQKASEAEIGRRVPITFIIVQKRHQTRVRPKDPRQGVGRPKNIPPGTYVDREITYPNTFDYFLCSHEGIRGTSKPARYTVLHDDNKFSPDELHQLSYHMCHMFVRCTRSVSIPAPVKYADLAAYRAKKYADFHLRKLREESSTSSGGSSIELPDFVRDAINDMENCRNQMFYV